MAKVKVHIVLENAFWDDSGLRARVVKDVEQVSGIAEINVDRLDRLGILSGFIDKSLVDKVRGVRGVKSVEVDKVRSLRKLAKR